MPDLRRAARVDLTHMISGEEKFLHRTLASVGVPPLHIVKAHNGVQYRFYELTGDLQDALHFRHFERSGVKLSPSPNSHGHVRLKGEVKLKGMAVKSTRGRVRLRG